MPNYVWKGKNRGGASQEGVLVADNKDAVIAILRKQQILQRSEHRTCLLAVRKGSYS